MEAHQVESCTKPKYASGWPKAARLRVRVKVGVRVGVRVGGGVGNTIRFWARLKASAS